MNYTATYSPEDNKLRLYPATRLGIEEYNRVKAAGFKWAPRQELFVAPMWTPQREDLLIEMCGEIGDEDKSLGERAEERAERFAGYSERRADDAERASATVDAITEHIPPGQPILIGHHSERRARKDAERIRSGMQKAVQNWKTSHYWTERAAGAIAHAKYKELPAVRLRRIKGLEADMRKHERNVKAAEEGLSVWEKCSQIEDSEKQRRFALLIAGNGLNRLTLKRKEGDDPTWNYACTPYDVLREEPSRFFVPRILDEIFEAAREAYPRSIAHQTRWIEHYQNRIAYERAMLGDYEAPKKAKRTLPPMTNVNCAGCHAMTAAEWKQIHPDYKGTREEEASAEYGPYRYRVAMVGKDGCARSLTRIFISDEKVKFVPKLTEDAPPPAAVPVPRFQLRHDIEEVLAQEASEMEQSRNVYAEARTAVPQNHRAPSHAELREMEQIVKQGVQVVAAPQLFPTPAHLAARMVALADIQPGQEVLEPSAGTGVLCKAIASADPTARVFAVELNHRLCESLSQTINRPDDRTEGICKNVLQGDFLECDGLGTFARIVMNPPFENAADIKHITRAASLLKPGGRLVALCANGPRQNDVLRRMVEEHGGLWEALPVDTFQSQGTSVRTVLMAFTLSR